MAHGLSPIASLVERLAMPLRIEDYAVIGNCETAALVGRDGSIDWLCLPRFDSGACFCALLGGPEHGRWLIAPADKMTSKSRGATSSDTLILETVFTTRGGSVSLTDFMYRRDGSSELVRIVRGLEGEVPMRTELVVRFDYGAIVPWVSQQEDGRLQFIAGPDSVLLDTTVQTRGEDLRTVGDFTAPRGRRGELRPQLVAVVSRGSSAALRGGARGGAQTSPFVLDRLGGGFQAAGPLGRRRSSLASDFEGARALGDRAASSRRRRRPCQNNWAGRATGTIDFAGFAMRPSPSMR